ncbi:acyltransferase family protein [Pseudomonas sp. 52 E 6]|uniref:acyltransferase family protein n=1 Tax=Pseudomonas sp. 52 E 6 TaxID=1844106 RepID=UPI0008122AD3|nr:acyltransferase [Pseudomonas sp. 52 E 6]CRM56869.1 putative membrane protein [Pseudomonas sp. 52 E 6]
MSVQSVRKHDYIDAIRGLAIILVVMTHASQYVKPLSDLLQRIMVEGARGVQLFYVASAVTLCMSWAARKSHEQSPILNFYIRRFFRIAPMFYLAIIGYLILNGFAATYWAPNGIEWWFVPVTALFLHGFHPETINSVVPGGWSIAVEMTFYLVFPFLMRFRKAYYFLGVLLVCVLLQRLNSYVSVRVFPYPPGQEYMAVNFSVLKFISQVPIFLMGVFAYLFLTRARVSDAKMLIVGGLLFFFLSVKFWTLSHKPVSHDVYAGAMFAVLFVLVAYYPVRILVNKFMIGLGKLSFSMYLTHFAVLSLFTKLGVVSLLGNGNKESVAYCFLVLIVSAGVSLLTYNFIERPGVSLGRRLIERLERANANSIIDSKAVETVK